MAEPHVTFRGWRCRVERATYGHTDRIALPLYDATDGEPVAVATINLPELALAADEVVIKDYSENEGMCTISCLRHSRATDIVAMHVVSVSSVFRVHGAGATVEELPQPAPSGRLQCTALPRVCLLAGSPTGPVQVDDGSDPRSGAWRVLNPLLEQLLGDSGEACCGNLARASHVDPMEPATVSSKHRPVASTALPMVFAYRHHSHHISLC